MVVRDFDFVRFAVAPDETDTPLIVYANTMLAFAIGTQGLQVISRRRSQIAKPDDCIQLPEFPKRDPLDASEPLDRLPVVELFRLPRPKRLNHLISLYCYPLHVKQYESKQIVDGEFENKQYISSVIRAD
jgi:hypothetical protein